MFIFLFCNAANFVLRYKLRPLRPFHANFGKLIARLFLSSLAMQARNSSPLELQLCMRGSTSATSKVFVSWAGRPNGSAIHVAVSTSQPGTNLHIGTRVGRPDFPWCRQVDSKPLCRPGCQDENDCTAGDIRPGAHLTTLRPGFHLSHRNGPKNSSTKVSLFSLEYINCQLS